MSEPGGEAVSGSNAPRERLPLESRPKTFERRPFDLQLDESGARAWSPSLPVPAPSALAAHPSEATTSPSSFALRGPPDERTKRFTMLFVCFVSFLNGATLALLPATVTAIEEEMGYDQFAFGAMFFAQFSIAEICCLAWILAAPWAISGKWALVVSTVVRGLVTMLQFWTSDAFSMAVLFSLSATMAYSRHICYSSFEGLSLEPHKLRCDPLVWCTDLGRICCAMLGASFSRRLVWGVPGWRVAYVLLGGLGVLVGLAMALCFGEVQKPRRSSSTLAEELAALRGFLRNPTFLLVLLQGFFGVQPWKAMAYRIFFLQHGGLQDLEAAGVHSFALLAVCFGRGLGNNVANALARKSLLHGRIWVAEIAVFGSIPFAWLTYWREPQRENSVLYYLIVMLAYGLVASWVGTGTNPAILASIASGTKGDLAKNTEFALENCLGSVVYLVFPVLAQRVYGYDAACPAGGFGPSCPDEDHNFRNSDAVGNALFWINIAPTLCCGILFVLLHKIYPEDIEQSLSQPNSELRGTSAGNVMDFEETSTVATTFFDSSPRNCDAQIEKSIVL